MTPFESDRKSPLDRLRKGLYSRNTEQGEAPRHSVHGEQVIVPESWDQEATAGAPGDPSTPGMSSMPHSVPPHRRIYKVILLGSAAFLLLAVGVAAYTFISGGNFVSVDNVDIQIQGPATIAGGEPLGLDVTVANKNQTAIQLVDLVVEYPSGSKDVTDPSKDLTSSRISLGDIASGGIAQQTVSSLLFGQEGDIKTIKLTAEYRTADSNAIFFKEKDYNVTISSSPVVVSIDSLNSVLSGAAFDMNVTVSSNSTSVIKNLLLTLDYPIGFSAVSASPAATYSDNIWDIGDLAPGTKKTFDIKVTATGDDSSSKTVHANVGIQDATNERLIATNIVTQSHDFTIEKPFLGLDLTLEGAHADLAATAGQTVHGDILWTNNSTSQITNATITAKLSGNVLDENSVTVDDGGFYDSSNNTITWQAGRATGLDSIAPAANGRVSFTVASVALAPGQSVANPLITIAVSANGSRTDETGAPQSVDTAVTRSIKLVSNLALSARALYSQGPFVNSGPMPPKVNSATTYTVVWTVTNTSNTITGATVTATLPPYVAWTGSISPSTANITYDKQSGNIVWAVGNVAQNADIGSGAQQVAFQISLTPSANQAGQVPTLIGSAAISGTDVFTGATLQNSAQALTTRLTTDLLYQPGNETVQQ